MQRARQSSSTTQSLQIFRKEFFNVKFTSLLAFAFGRTYTTARTSLASAAGTITTFAMICIKFFNFTSRQQADNFFSNTFVIFVFNYISHIVSRCFQRQSEVVILEKRGRNIYLREKKSVADVLTRLQALKANILKQNSSTEVIFLKCPIYSIVHENGSDSFSSEDEQLHEQLEILNL